MRSAATGQARRAVDPVTRIAWARQMLGPDRVIRGVRVSILCVHHSMPSERIFSFAAGGSLDCLQPAFRARSHLQFMRRVHEEGLDDSALALDL